MIFKQSAMAAILFVFFKMMIKILYRHVFKGKNITYIFGKDILINE